MAEKPRMTAERRAQIELLKGATELVNALTALVETLNEALIAELGEEEEED